MIEQPRNHRELRKAAAHLVRVTYHSDPVVARYECRCGWTHEGNPLPSGQSRILDEMVAEMTVYDHAGAGHWYIVEVNGHWYANTGGSTSLVSRATTTWLESGMP